MYLEEFDKLKNKMISPVAKLYHLNAKNFQTEMQTKLRTKLHTHAFWIAQTACQVTQAWQKYAIRIFQKWTPLLVAI